MRRDHPPRRDLAEGIASAIAASTGGADENDARSGRLIAFGGNNTAGPIDVPTARNVCNSASVRLDFESETFVVHGTQDPEIRVEQAYTIGRNNGMENGVFSFQERGRPDGRCIDIGGDVAYALTSPGDGDRGMSGTSMTAT